MRRHLVLLNALGCLCALLTPLWAQADAAAPPPAASPSNLRVSIALGAYGTSLYGHNSARELLLPVPRHTAAKKTPIEDYIYVVIENVSNHPVTLWSQSGSEGIGAVTLEILSVDGKPLDQPLVIRRGFEGPQLNLDGPGLQETLQPLDTTLRYIPLARTDRPLDAVHPERGTVRIEDYFLYSGWPLPAKPGAETMAITMRAVYAYTDAAKGINAWVGKVYSPTREYTVELPK